MGNGDRVVLAQMAGGDTSEVPPQFAPLIRHNAEELDTRHQRLLAGWPKTLSMDVEGLGEVLFCHATPRNDMEVFTRITPEAQLAPVFDGVTARVVVCGHTHVQFDRMIGSTRVVNAGSIGMPFMQPAGAYWALLGPGIQLRYTAYDLSAAVDRIRRTSCPQVEETIVRYVLTPQSEEDTIRMFTPAEIGRQAVSQDA
jgi:diadenosine tetraphosphatase ApaH/serine/threonine PP2A family protein phosphatase